MAQKSIEIGLRFYDLGDSLKNIANQFASATAGSGLGKGLSADIDAIGKAANDFKNKISSLEGEKLSLIDIEGLISDGEVLKQRLNQLIKETQDYYKNAGLDKILGEQLDSVNSSINKNKDSLGKLQDKLSSLNKVSEDTVQSIGALTTIKTGSLVKITDIDTLQKQLIAQRTELEKTIRLQTDASGQNMVSEAQKSDLEILNFLISENRTQLLERNKIEGQVNKTKTKITELEKEKLAIEKNAKNLTDEQIRVLASLNSQLLVEENNLKNLKHQLSATTKEQEKSSIVNEKTRESIRSMVGQFFSLQQIIHSVRRVINEGVQAVKQLDTSFTEIAMVTSYSTDEVWKMKDAFLELAETTGLTVTEVSKLSVEFFRQGRSLSEVIKLTEAAGIAAKLAGISTGDSVRYLTSAINGYRLAADQAMVVSDKFAALAAESATDYEELATALSKVASQAYTAGVGMDSMLGFIAKALETTREAPENIGTAFKTIFARMQEIKDYGKTLEDGMDVNRVETALNQIGVALRDQSGEMRNLDEVLIDTGKQWPQLTKNQKAYIATALAGTRQQTRLLAVFEDFDRTLELISTSSDSLGASYAQQQKYYDSIEYSITQLNTSWQEFVTNIVSSDIVISMTQVLNTLVEILNAVAGNQLGQFALVVGGLTYGFVALKEAMKALKITETLGKINENFITLVSNSKTGFKDFINGFKEARLAATNYKKAKDLVNKSEIVAQTIQQASNAGKDASLIKNKLLTVAELKKKAAIDAANTSLAAQIGLLLGNPLTWVALAVVAFAGAMIKAGYDSYKLNGSLKNLEKTTRDYAATAYNANKKLSDIDSLVDKYNELASQVNLTAEEEQQMLEYAQQIQDLAGETQVIGIDGELNTDAVDQVIKDTAEELNTTVQDSYKNIVDGLSKGVYAYSEMDAISKEYYQLGEAMKTLGAETKEEFDAMSEKSKQYAKDLANARAEATYGGIEKIDTGALDSMGNPILETRIIPLLDENQLKQVEDKITESVYNTWNDSNALEMSEMLKDITAGMNEEQIKIINGMLDGADTIVKITDMFGSKASEVLANIGTDLDKVDEIFATLSNFQLKDESLKLLTGAIIDLGPINGFNSVVNQLGLNFEETLNIASQLNDLEFANLRTSDTLAGLKGITERYVELQSMLSGDADFDISALKSAVQENEKLAEGIANNGRLSQAEIKTAVKLQEDAAIAELKLENVKYENEIKINQKKLDLYKEILSDEVYLSQLTEEQFAELNAAGLLAQYTDFKAYQDKKTKYAIRQQEIINKANFLMQDDISLTWDQALSQAEAMISGLSLSDMDLDLKGALGLEDLTDAVWNAKDAYQGIVDGLEKSIKEYKAYIAINNAAIAGIENSTLYFEELTQTVEELAEAMTEVEKALLGLSSTNSAMSLLEAQADNLEGEALIQNLNTQISLMNKRLDLMRETDAAYAAANSSILSSINANNRLANSLTFEEGRLVTTEQFLNLTAEERDVVLDLAEAYNKNADAIIDNKIAIEKEFAALEEANDAKLDMISDTKEIIIAAREEELQASLDSIDEALKEAQDAAQREIDIKNLILQADIDRFETEKNLLEDRYQNEKKLLEDTITAEEKASEELRKLTKDSLDARIQAEKDAAEESNKIAEKNYQNEKELLQKRKDLYSKSWTDQEYTDNLAELAKQREDLIIQLANLEGATDLTSLQKRQELLSQKADLDKEYNDTVRDYNRNALLESIDLQIQGVDATEQARKEAYDLERKAADERYKAEQDALTEAQRLAKELEDQANKDRLVALEEQFKKDQELIASKIDSAKQLQEFNDKSLRDQLVLDENGNAITLEGTLDRLERQAQAQKDYINDVLMSGEALNKFADETLAKGNDATLSYIKTFSNEYANATAEAKEMMLEEWKDYVGQTKEILSELNGVIDKGTYQSTVDTLLKSAAIGTGMNTMLQNVVKASTTDPSETNEPQKTKTISRSYIENAGSSYSQGDYKIQPRRKVIVWSDGTTTYESVDPLKTYIGSATVKATATTANYTTWSKLDKFSSIGAYSSGGLATDTGLAMLHGTVGAPERVLSPVQTELFDNMVKQLEKLSTTGGTNLSESITIGNISINTPQLNTNADFASAGKALAAEFRSAISSRGLNINKKR